MGLPGQAAKGRFLALRHFNVLDASRVALDPSLRLGCCGAKAAADRGSLVITEGWMSIFWGHIMTFKKSNKKKRKQERIIWENVFFLRIVRNLCWV